MATQDDKQDDNGTAQPPPGGEADSPGGSSSGLMLLGDEDRDHVADEDALGELAASAAPDLGSPDQPAAVEVDDDALKDLAAAAPAAAPDALGDLAAAAPQQAGGLPPELAGQPDEPAAGGALGDLAAASAPEALGSLGDMAAVSDSVRPAVSAQRTTRLQANVRRVHAQQYKKTMIPLLLVVGLMLIAFSIITLVMLVGSRADPDHVAGEMTYMQAYGKFFVVIALPIGAILLVGAWLFYMDIKRTTRRTG